MHASVPLNHQLLSSSNIRDCLVLSTKKNNMRTPFWGSAVWKIFSGWRWRASIDSRFSANCRFQFCISVTDSGLLQTADNNSQNNIEARRPHIQHPHTQSWKVLNRPSASAYSETASESCLDQRTTAWHVLLKRHQTDDSSDKVLIQLSRKSRMFCYYLRPSMTRRKGKSIVMRQADV